MRSLNASIYTLSVINKDRKVRRIDIDEMSWLAKREIRFLNENSRRRDVLIKYTTIFRAN